MSHQNRKRKNTETIRGSTRKKQKLNAQNSQRNKVFIIPNNVTAEFQSEYAAQDLTANKETAALLFAKKEHIQSQNVPICTVVIPKQTGDANSCVISAEEEIIYISTKNNLTLIGWMHSHPRQDNFLSSIDLHTTWKLCNNDFLFVAIVCSPNDSEGTLFGTYNLTELGMSALAACKLQGHHTHEVDNVDMTDMFYMQSKHVAVTDVRKAMYVDLRKSTFTMLSADLADDVIMACIQNAAIQLKDQYEPQILADAVQYLCTKNLLLKNDDTENIISEIEKAISQINN
eukprot:226705_1